MLRSLTILSFCTLLSLPLAMSCGPRTPTRSEPEAIAGSKPKAPVAEPKAPVTEPKAPVTEPKAPVTEPEAPVTEPEAAAVEPKSELESLKDGAAWGSGDHRDLVNMTKASAEIEMTVKDGDNGIIMESGGSILGLALYIHDGVLYFQCGSGGSYGAEGQSVCKKTIKAGKHTIAWSADSEKNVAALFIDGEKVAMSDSKIAEFLGGTDAGGLGQRGDSWAVNAGNFGQGPGLAASVTSCTVFPGQSLFEAAP